ncbi:MAG: 2OG-Fe(II) oxygenase [Betaproteobacteria bacterium]|nr:2OG-Fe(II) oxygenase [Gammaproteobacteria bacterium]MDH5577791.1 2OG-Fe(II) oxygenase [Betaproteobacteria bacterium]
MALADARIREVKPLSFIYEKEKALPADVCAEAIRRFEASVDQQAPGRIGQAGEVAPQVKRSTDLRISGREDWKDIDRILSQQLVSTFNVFALEFPFFAANKFKDIGYNLQRTLPGEYYHWHVDGGPGEFSARQMVAIWYLNDVPGPGGETEFPLQEVRVRPAAGKLLLFPPFWTHVHRGVTLEKGVKYIATTWVCFA